MKDWLDKVIVEGTINNKEFEEFSNKAIKDFANELVGLIVINDNKKIKWEKFLEYVRQLLNKRGIKY